MQMLKFLLLEPKMQPIQFHYLTNFMMILNLDQLKKFVIDTEELGEIQLVKLTQDGKGLFSDWFVDYIKITNLRNGDTQQWTSDQWVSSNQILVFHNSQYQFNKEFDKISQMNDEELKKNINLTMHTIF